MEFLAMYDIADPKRLRKVEKTMKRFGYRIQKSVFECSLTPGNVEQMKKAVSLLINPKEDAFRIYPLLADSRHKQILLGKGDIPEFPQIWII